MRILYAPLLAVALAASAFCADPPKVDPAKATLKAGKPVTVVVGRKCVLEVETTAKKVTWKIPAGVDTESPDGKKLYVWATEGTHNFLALVPNGDDVLSAEVVLTVTGARPPPVPPGPGPVPPGPTPPPGPVTSFRVMFVYESANTLTPAEKGVVYGGVVEDYLIANCTGGKAGFRRRDKDAGGEFDPVMREIWAEVQTEFLPPKNTPTPAAVIQVNGKIVIEPLPKTPAEMVALLKTYRR